ncbi:hypothetical protein SLNWT_1351 [Streptomyces albus]|uniref:Uncharacterized protein n=1 Tax=Streptomyces albus (strain ATCC 21838 / DSM 41398 / FERM P-419 / JCM 4703 / NBRC 107858) TaxID=1081613 RepID=A0A0B5EUD1_STRA4|nr:hypothetical protein SLNWT_1351 [Streptomyces albus]AOU76043.1 hypothetical protein SLNHY_1352 [Streptomyces albus]
MDRRDGRLGVGGQTLRGGGVRIGRRSGAAQNKVERVVVLGVLVGQVEEPFDGRGRWRHVEEQGIGRRLGHARRHEIGYGWMAGAPVR